MKIKQAVTLLSSLVLSSSVLAASQDSGRWFDIEVILISQLADKTSLKEVFASDVKLPRFKKPLDLLTPYLSPDIASLKQSLPFCDSKNKLIPYHDAIQVPSIIEIKSLTAITEQVSQENNSDNTLTTNTVTQEPNDNSDDFFDRVLTEKEKATQDPHFQELSNNLNALHPKNKDVEPALSAKQIALVNAAQAYFSAKKLNYTDTAPKQNKLLCQITQNEFDLLAPNKNRYSYLGFPVNNVPSEVSATEDLYNKNPYLLNHDSLALHDIVKQLKRSRDFRPMLHIGWRQPVSSRRRAIPIKLFAGDNLQQHYYAQLESYQQQKAQAQEQSLNTLLSSNISNKTQLTEQEKLIQNKERRLAHIIEQLSTIADDTSRLISEIERAPASLTTDDMVSNTLLFEPPTPPIQPWYLQGFMQIYINNNNRLNIIADFNVLNLTLAEQETIKLRPNAKLNIQTIPFKQHRQVISTETHYFDHPYLGMIVQIRRHDRPELPEK